MTVFILNKMPLWKSILRGGLTGNLSKFWKSIDMGVYIAGTLSRPYVYKKAMELFLAGEHPVKNGKEAD